MPIALGLGLGLTAWRGVGGPGAVALSAPAGFGYTPPFTVSKSGSTYTTSFSMDAVKPTATHTIYVGPGGDNANTGQGSYANRVRSLKQALVRAAALGGAATPRILALPGQYLFSNADGGGIQDSFAGQYYDGHFIIEPCDTSGNEVATSAATRIVSVQNQVMPAFSLVSGSVYVSTYTTERPSPVAWDLSLLNAKGNPQALHNAPPATSYANEAAIVVGVAAMASLYGHGAVWIDTTNKKFYIQTRNGRAPDADIMIGRGNANSNQATERNLYLGGRYGGVQNAWLRNVHTWGGCGLYAAINQAGGENRGIGLYWADGATLYSCINGVNGDGAYTLTFLRHAADDNYKDGFNYDQASGFDPLGTAIGRFNEIDCSADWNGHDSQGETSCNASSAHVRVQGVSVNFSSNRTLNRAINDISAAQRWVLNPTITNIRVGGRSGGAIAAGFASAGASTETAKVWVEGGTLTGNIDDFQGQNGGALRYANFSRTPVTYTVGGGTVSAYNSPPAVPGATGTLSAAALTSSTVQLTFTNATGAASHEYRVNGGAATALAGDKIVNGLTQLTAYTFEVRGVNSDGNGAWSNVANATTPASATPTNILLNGNFAGGTTSWSGFGFNGKSVTSGKGQFVATTAFDGINQASTPFIAGKYYDVQYTLVVTSGKAYAYFSGGTGRNGTNRSASGTYTERLLANTGNNNFGFQGSTTITMTIDDITVTGPYDTP